MKKLIVIATTILASQLALEDAHAQLWDALDTLPKANMIFGIDTSVTMRITPSCNGCHKQPRADGQRMTQVRQELLNTLPLFRTSFAYGGFVYSGSGFAKVRRDAGWRGVSLAPRVPDATNIETSYNRVVSMIDAIDTQGSKERYLPGGSEVSCITPQLPNATTCSGDATVIDAVLTGGLAPALTFPPIPPGVITCTLANPPVQTIDVQAEFRRNIETFDWPRYPNGQTERGEVQTDFCDRLEEAADRIERQIALCVTDVPAVFDRTAYRCDAGALADTVCATSSPFAGTCLCDPTARGCGGGQRISECGVNMELRARQQVALCAAYDDDGVFGPYFRSQTDNVVNGGEQVCRENVLMMFTDGFAGDQARLPEEFVGARQTYRSRAFGTPPRSLSNAFVFRVATPFAAAANQLAVTFNDGRATDDDGQPVTAYEATNQTQMLNSFATIANRIQRGTYTGANLAFNRFGDRVALHIFDVPGPPNHRYLGRPSRIAWHEINADGQILPDPIFETDWAHKVPGNGNPFTPLGGGSLDILGPSGTWRNGVSKTFPAVGTAAFPAGTLDRNGDGVIDATGENPFPVRWGFMLGGGASAPVVVEAPRDLPSGGDAVQFALFQRDPDVRERPRVIYAMSNGYVHAIHAGTYATGAAASRFGAVQRSFGYDDLSTRATQGGAGSELWRFRPRFLDRHPLRSLNDVVQQDLLNGQMIAREVHLRSPPRGTTGACPDDAPCFATVLILGQGTGGGSYAALNITNPAQATNRSTEMWEATLPAGDTATNKPTIYAFPTVGTVPTPNPMMVVTGGLGGSQRLYAYSVLTGTERSRANLPSDAGDDYPTAPVCLDATGKQTTTHCYVLSRLGRLWRVPITTAGQAAGTFGAPVDISLADASGGGRQYYTSPVVYFGADNNINIAFGSGDVERLEANDNVQNRVIRAVDNFSTAASGATVTTTDVCSAASGGTSGVIDLAVGERVISPPIIAKGVVAWTTYAPGTDGCVAGTGRLYAIDFQTCVDRLDTANTNRTLLGKDIGAGIHTSPSLLRTSERLATYSSADPTASQVLTRTVQTRGGTRKSIKRIYWRPVLSAP